MARHVEQERQIKIPVRITDGKVMFYYGGDLPPLEDGALGDLVVRAEAVLDPEFLARWRHSHVEEMLPAGETVLLAVRYDIPRHLLHHTVNPKKLIPRLNGRFVPVRLEEPLRLRIRARKPAALERCQCYIPALSLRTRSLNHAFASISEAFEPERMTHSGSVFRLGYFLSEDCWRPLSLLRDHYMELFEPRLVC